MKRHLFLLVATMATPCLPLVLIMDKTQCWNCTTTMPQVCRCSITRRWLSPFFRRLVKIQLQERMKRRWAHILISHSNSQDFFFTSASSFVTKYVEDRKTRMGLVGCIYVIEKLQAAVNWSLARLVKQGNIDNSSAAGERRIHLFLNCLVSAGCAGHMRDEWNGYPTNDWSHCQ